jgi:hypothetical protein
MPLKDYHDLVKQLRVRNPSLTLQQAREMAKKLRTIKAIPTAPPIIADTPTIKSPIYQVPPVIHNLGTAKEKEQLEPVIPVPELVKSVVPIVPVPVPPFKPIPTSVELNRPDFKIDEIVHDLRSGSGLMHFRNVMYAHLQGRGTIVEDGMDGRNHVCHIEVDGFRIPPDPDDYFKY